ncbi:MAG: FHIPEP family type III secretion protein [Spirochaetales bacterium]|nr:FHIPEP family type III secretion protein [Spirochaetales bacterium]
MPDNDSNNEKPPEAADILIVNENKTAVALSLSEKVVKSSLSLLRGLTFSYVPGPGVIRKGKGDEAGTMIADAGAGGTPVIHYPRLAEALYGEYEPGEALKEKDWKYSSVFRLKALVYRENGTTSFSPDPEDPVPSERGPSEPLYFNPLTLEVGFGLSPLITDQTALLKRMSRVRREIALSLGLVVPRIVIRANMNLEPDEYRISLKGIAAGKGTLRISKYLAIETKRVREKVRGEAATEPAFNLPAIWIDEEVREKAERSGYSVVDTQTLLTTHLIQIIRHHASRLLGTQEVKNILDSLAGDYPALVEEITGLLGKTEIKQVLCALLDEGVSIRNIIDILETLADHGPQMKKPERLVEKVRERLGLHICSQFLDKNGVLHVIAVNPQGDRKLLDYGEEYTDMISPAESGAYKHFFAGLDAAMKQGKKEEDVIPVLVCSRETRTCVRKLTHASYPRLPVLSTAEIPPAVPIKKIGDISI